jgi:hypothetical protein
MQERGSVSDKEGSGMCFKERDEGGGMRKKKKRLKN